MMKQKAPLYFGILGGGIFLTVLFLVFLYFLFPEDLAKQAIENAVNRHSGLNLEIHGSIRVALPNGLQCTQAELRFSESGIRLPITNMTVRLPFSSLLHPLQTIQVTCLLQRGVLESRLLRQSNENRYVLQTLSVRDLSLDDPGSHAFNSPLKGTVTGDATCTFSSDNYRKCNANFTIQNGVFDFRDRLLPILTFQKATGTLTRQDDGPLFTSLNITGHDFDARLQGNLDFTMDHPTTSPLHLTGEYSLDDELASIFSNRDRGDSNGRLSVSGTLAEPRITLQ